MCVCVCWGWGELVEGGACMCECVGCGGGGGGGGAKIDRTACTTCHMSICLVSCYVRVFYIHLPVSAATRPFGSRLKMLSKHSENPLSQVSLERVPKVVPLTMAPAISSLRRRADTAGCFFVVAYTSSSRQSMV